MHTTHTTTESTIAAPADTDAAVVAPVDTATDDAVLPADPDALAALLAQAAPSAGPLDELQCERLTPAGCLDAVLAWERHTRHAHAGLIRALAALARPAEARDLAETELTAALAWPPATAQHRLAEADALTRLFPETLALLSDARISLQQARTLPDLTYGLDESTARTVQAQILPRMPGQSAAATRQAIRRAIVRTDPDAAAKRHEHERTRRRVELIPENDGMPDFRLRHFLASGHTCTSEARKHSLSPMPTG